MNMSDANPSMSDPFPTRLARSYDLTPDCLGKLSQYILLFAEWNSKFRFSKFSSPEAIADHLIGPSLALHVLLPLHSRIIDLGSGPGIPGIPIAILRPDLHLSLLESGISQLEFLQACKSGLALDRVEILEGRAEELAHDPLLRASFDCVIARAFAPLPIVVEVASGYIRPGGLLTIQSSGSVSTRLADRNDASATVGAIFDRLGAVLPAADPQYPIYYIRYCQCKAPPSKYPRPWKKMKKNPLWSD